METWATGIYFVATKFTLKKYNSADFQKFYYCYQPINIHIINQVFEAETKDFKDDVDNIFLNGFGSHHQYVMIKLHINNGTSNQGQNTTK